MRRIRQSHNGAVHDSRAFHFVVSNPTVATAGGMVLVALIIFSGSAYARPSTATLTNELGQVINTYYQAIASNQLEQAMRQYHSRSPQYSQTRKKVRNDLSQFLLKTTTTAFCYTGQQASTAVVRARHRYLMITGMKFITYPASVEYRLRQEQGSWKIWARREDPNATLELSGCY